MAHNEIDRDAVLPSVARTLMPAVAAVKMPVPACGLTGRQTEIMALVVAGDRSKTIAANLGISQRTVENHRAAIMQKTGTRSLPALARLALTAEGEVGRSRPADDKAAGRGRAPCTPYNDTVAGGAACRRIRPGSPQN